MKLSDFLAPRHRGPAIFISYRDADTKTEASKLYDALTKKWGAGTAFLDSDSILLGDKFKPDIRTALRSSSVVLAVIGPKWLSPLKRGQSEASASTDDWVTAELACALNFGHIVIPVLIEETPMPSQSEIDPSIAEITELTRVRLSQASYEKDLAKLLRRIAKALAKKHDSHRVRWLLRRAKFFPPYFILILRGFIIAVILGALIWVMENAISIYTAG